MAGILRFQVFKVLRDALVYKQLSLQDQLDYQLMLQTGVSTAQASSITAQQV